MRIEDDFFPGPVSVEARERLAYVAIINTKLFGLLQQERSGSVGEN